MPRQPKDEMIYYLFLQNIFIRNNNLYLYFILEINQKLKTTMLY